MAPEHDPASTGSKIDIDEVQADAAVAPKRSFSTWLRRREDFLALRFHFYNLKLADNTLSTANQASPSYVVVEFPPQNLAEQAFFETDGGMTVDPEEPVDLTVADEAETLVQPIEVKARLSGPTRLAFVVPKGESIPYTAAGLLNWARFAMKVVPWAVPRYWDQGPGLHVRPGRPTEPDERETQIELPWSLVLSPHSNAGWAHKAVPVNQKGTHTELWHTRMGLRTAHSGVDEAEPGQRTVRAIWARDKNFSEQLVGVPPKDANVPFRMSLTPLDRYDLVRLSSDFTIADYEPEPVDVDRLMLSSLGAWIDVAGQWDPPLEGAYKSDLLQWRQRGAMGRDAYVRVVRKGHLFPWSHRAVLIKITERKLQRNIANDRGAYLRQRIFAVVTQQRKDYDTAPGRRHDLRAFPFRSLRITTLVTPNLNDKTYFGALTAHKVFLMEVDQKPFPFHFVASDWAGQTVEFDAPAVFVSSTTAYSAADTQQIVDAYALKGDDVRLAALKGQKVALAPSAKLGDTTVMMDTIRFGADVGAQSPEDQDPPGPVPTDGQLIQAGQPRFYPTMERSSIRMPAADQARGTPLAPSIVKYDADYVAMSFDPDLNPGAVFLAMTQGATALDFQADRSGGVLTPNLSINGISRTLGPVGGDLQTTKTGQFVPSKFFNATAKILGGINLFDIVDDVPLLGGAPAGALKLSQVELSDRVETRLDWHPPLKAGPPGLTIFDPHGDKRLDLEAILTSRHTTPPTSSFAIRGEIRNFKLNLIGSGATMFLVIDVNRLTFTAGSNQKSDVDVDIRETKFDGVLHFVSELAEYCSFGSGLTVDVRGDRIAVGTSIDVPDIAVGVFSLRNIAVIVGITIPFDGSPVRMRFAFGERSDQFILTVTIFGGGGFFGIELGADGMELLEAALEFGASCSLDVGVASGSVELIAGIYFKIENTDEGENCTLTGYVRVGGELDVMGVVTLSLEFYMGIEYQSQPEKVVGEASMTVEISVLVFSGSVTIRVRRSFGSGPNDPTFGDVLTPADWAEYCDAFASIGA